MYFLPFSGYENCENWINKLQKPSFNATCPKTQWASLVLIRKSLHTAISKKTNVYTIVSLFQCNDSSHEERSPDQHLRLHGQVRRSQGLHRWGHLPHVRHLQQGPAPRLRLDGTTCQESNLGPPGVLGHVHDIETTQNNGVAKEGYHALGKVCQGLLCLRASRADASYAFK